MQSRRITAVWWALAIGAVSVGCGGDDGDTTGSGQASSGVSSTGAGGGTGGEGGGTGGAGGVGGASACTTAADCNDNNACTADACKAGICSSAPIDLNDNNACTIDACEVATGVSHAPININDNDACTIDACDSTTGGSHTPININDNDACTLDACDSTTGVSHKVIDPNDGNICTLDACDPVAGVSHIPVDPSDGDACTLDACDPVTGITHTPVDLDDGNACTVDACDAIAGVTHLPIDPDDGNVCTADACDPVVGITHTPVDMDDNDPCSIDLCDPATGVIHVTDPDGDGWASCDGDCCELSSPTCLSPALVNPGAFEILNNNVDDDCDAASFDTLPPAPCSATFDFSAVTALDVAKAMDICNVTTQNPPLSQKRWGVISAQQLRADGAVPTASGLLNIQNSQTAILVDYGTGGIVPVKGPTMAGLSTGMMRDPSDPGYIPPNSGTSFSYNGQPPASYLAAHGGALPSSMSCLGSCSAGADANDAVNIRLSIRAPTNAHSFAYDVRFFTADFASRACQPWNDLFLALLQSGAPGIPADKNIAFDSSNNVFSVNNSFIKVCAPQSCYTCPHGAGQLAGTGMNNVGGGTLWLTTDAPVVPGETFQLELMIFDVDDNVYDTVALLDNFRWSPSSAVVNTHE